MRMLMPKRTGRDFGSPVALSLETLDEERAAVIQESRQRATNALGARQERLGSTLDEVARLSGHLKHLDGLVAELRQPLQDELVAHRNELGDLITTRALLEQTAQRLQQSRRGEQELAAHVAGLELALETAQAERNTHDTAGQDARLEIDRLRTVVADTGLRADNALQALNDATLRMRQLEEDIAFLRRQNQEDDAFRREVDALLARASQESLLLEEEVATLRRRLEQATSDAFRLAGVEAELQGQLSNERARAAAEQATAERAQADLIQAKAYAEEQSTSARSEISALSTRLETSGARAARLETLNADLAKRVSEATAKHRSDERRVSEVQTSGERTAERALALEEELAAQRGANATLERARLTALERAEQLGKLLQSHELTMRRAEERLRALQIKLDASTAEQAALRQSGEQAAAGASSEIERLRAELAMAEAGLKSAHEERSRQHLATLNGAHYAASDAPFGAVN